MSSSTGCLHFRIMFEQTDIEIVDKIFSGKRKTIKDFDEFLRNNFHGIKIADDESIILIGLFLRAKFP